MLFISMTMALVALGVDLLLPAFDDIRASFDLAEDSTGPALLITTYFVGLALAQLMWGPIADRFGRRPVLHWALAVYCIGALGAAVAPAFGLLLASRFVWGIGAAGARVVAIAMIRDQHEGDRMAAFMSRVMAIFLIVPVFAPLLGEAVLQVAHWRWLFWLTVVLAILLGAWGLRVNETLDPAHTLPLEWRAVGKAFARVAKTRVTLAYMLVMVFMQGVFVSYLASSELVIDTVFDREEQFAVIFAAVACALGVASLVAARAVAVMGGERMLHVGLRASLVLSLVLLAVTIEAGGRPHFWVFFPLLALLMMITVALMPTLNSLALVPLGDIAGTATSVTGAVRTAGGGLLGAVIDRTVSGSVTPWAVAFALGSLLSIATVQALIPRDVDGRTAG